MYKWSFIIYKDLFLAMFNLDIQDISTLSFILKLL